MAKLNMMSKSEAEQQGLIDNNLIDIYTKYYQDTQPTIELISSLTIDDKGNRKFNELITNYCLKVLSEYGCNMTSLGEIHRLDIDPDSSMYQEILKFEGLKVLDPMLVDDLLIIMSTLINIHLRYFVANGEPSDDSKTKYVKTLGMFYVDVIKNERLYKFFDMGTTNREALDKGLVIIDWLTLSCTGALSIIKLLFNHLQEKYGKDSKVMGYPYLFTFLNREPYVYYVYSKDL